MNKNIIITIVVIVVILIGVLVWYFMSGSMPSTNSGTNNEPESVQDNDAKDSNSNTNTNNTKVIAEPISYANALVKYADRRIQIDTMCQAHPSNITYKDNTGIMIDNRSPKTRTVKVGTTFTIKPWGFKIVILPDIYLKSKTLLVDCDGSRNIATILVQE